jgi:hypothetical protein
MAVVQKEIATATFSSQLTLVDARQTKMFLALKIKKIPDISEPLFHLLTGTTEDTGLY